MGQTRITFDMTFAGKARETACGHFGVELVERFELLGGEDFAIIPGTEERFPALRLHTRAAVKAALKLVDEEMVGTYMIEVE